MILKAIICIVYNIVRKCYFKIGVNVRIADCNIIVPTDLIGIIVLLYLQLMSLQRQHDYC
jgi:hypothetical protein